MEKSGCEGAGTHHMIESFAAKIRYGNGLRFDPIMEERGSWIVGEVLKHDIVMIDVVIEVLVEASKQIGSEELNPFKGITGEILSLNLERSFRSFLARKDAISFKINSQTFLACIALLRHQLLIAKFVGSKPPLQAMRLWLKTLNQELRGSTLTLCRSVGK